MSLVEINFDGIVGPSHNYAGLSPGNLAATRSAGAISRPRDAALQGVAKMRATVALGLTQGILLPHARPDRNWLTRLATSYEDAAPYLQAQALSASAMWAANAATVSPAPDTADGRCHLTVANLLTMPHRSHEWPETLAQLRLAFADPAFIVHPPVPPPYGDEGAANHMRLASAHDAAGVEIFVHGVAVGGFPGRQHKQASATIARRHGLDPARTLFVRQSDAAIAAGAFHNDVVAVANRNVLFTHEHAFADRARFLSQLRARVPDLELIEVPASAVSLGDAIDSYLFNAQLVTAADGATVLIAPQEAAQNRAVAIWLAGHVAGNGAIRRVEYVDVRESMANGGGPACLRLRVVADPATVDPRFLVDAARLDRIATVIERHWPEAIGQNEIGHPALIAKVEAARDALLSALDLVGLIDR
ncbi:MAG: N-succinylarginine dihydrolase [Pseudomonadota bacterium]